MMSDSERSSYQRQIADLNATVADLRARLAAAEREIAQLRGAPIPEPVPVEPEFQRPPLAPYDSPVHDALIRASMQGDQGKVIELLNAGANPNHSDQLGSTPLHWAAQGGHDVIIPILINSGASLKAKNVKKLTPQEVAAGKAKLNKAIWKEPKKR